MYVLDARLQNAGGAGPPQWDPRSRLEIYLGHSQSHAGSVSLILNPRTGLVSPQFHIVVDNDFATVPSLRAGTMPANWHQSVTNSREKSTEGFYDVTKTWLKAGIDEAATTNNDAEVMDEVLPTRATNIITQQDEEID